ncbi:MaoC/PaaZ C-terminal domain-containing protein [Microbacterium sp. LWS13-1.2]|uniref:MaoC family dehydratase N-terminal domain-containing protein n=1 Tax=Microbacterium sp. LWS13-1.2 TaxID=3135264 RepID=A0AAU6SBR5_9MICO
MPMDLTYVGMAGEPTERSWTVKDTLLYAVAVGAGHGDPSRELEFATENSSVAHRVLPSFICVASGGRLPEGFSIDMTRMLHAEMSFELLADLPAEGRVVSTARVDGIYDKGSGALVSTVTDVVDAETGAPLARLGSGLFIRGEGGYGGDRGTKDDWAVPDREPDATIHYDTLPEQALIYRLTGDRNPLHSDPVFAQRAGFPAPILHGMCTYGITARGLLHAVADSDPSVFGSMYGRFTKPVQLGEELDIQVWKTDGGALFRTLDSAGDVVIDRGRVTLRGRP